MNGERTSGESNEGARREEHLRSFLASFDQACPGCGYSLHGLTGTRCPECNQELKLQVGLVEPRLGAYLAALAGPLAGTGIGVLMLGFIAYFTLRQGPPRGREVWPIYGITSISTSVFVSMLVVLLQRGTRVWFRRATVSQWVFAVLGCWSVPVACIAWFLWTISRM